MKKGLCIFCLLALGILALGAMKPMTPGKMAHAMTLLSSAATSLPGRAPQTQEYSVMGAPSLSPTFINSILCTASSPACGTGQALYDDSLKYGIDDVFALAFFQHESTFGRYGIAHVNLGLGNIRCSSGYICKSGFRAYSSWTEGYADWYQLIAWYVSDLHKSTVSQIVTTYAPSSENNTSEYINSIQQAATAWRAAAIR